MISVRTISLYNSKYKLVSFAFFYTYLARCWPSNQANVTPIVPFFGSNTNATFDDNDDILDKTDSPRSDRLQSLISSEWKIDFSHLELGFIVAKAGYSQVFKGRYFHCDVAVKNLFTTEVSYFVMFILYTASYLTLHIVENYRWRSKGVSE